MPSIADYWSPVVITGFGLAIDLAIATLSRSHDRSINLKNWALALAATHALLPTLSCLIFWSIGSLVPQLYGALGIIGFVLVGCVVYEIFCEAIGTEPRFSLTDKISTLLKIDKNVSKHIALILLVSWDAFLCGPAVLTLATNGDWTFPWLLLAFTIFGLFAGCIAACALLVTTLLRKKKITDTTKLALFNFIGEFAAMSVIGGFGIMSLCATVTDNGDIYWSVFAAALFMFIPFAHHRKVLWQHAKQKAIESVFIEIEQTSAILHKH